ncbi:protein PFC0760c-like [Chelonus insularis]|uniref:protein PFC0760c-like n=1 Tax=Chelonus insularis TaxID=460826 RepID=UPI00158C8592|nr:protein PFC0760c-like [Chelonus insularis]
MSYSGNLPDWHQFNSPQHGRTGTSSVQNVNSSHLFLPSINPSALDTINLTTNDRQSKHQRNDVSYGTRNYQASSMSGSTCGTNSTSSVHMASLSSCVGHYGSSPTRNPMMESLSASIDPRIPPVGSLNETELPHRTNQLPFNASNNHTGAPSIHGGMGSQTSPVGPMSPGRQIPPYGACKGPCCNPDTNIPFHHWDKYSNYPPNPPYRDSMRSASYHGENRRFMPEMNLRKDCIENKELVSHGFGVENRRSYSDYKYRKDLPRNYPAASGLLQNYPIQNYNFPSDYQKCPYSVKEYLRRSGPSGGALINHQNTGIVKYPDHQNVNIQQKYNNKQISYQNGALPTGMSSSGNGNLPSPLQNSYFNPQLPRDIPRDFPREYQETNAVGNRLPTSPSAVMHGPYQKYHVYQQKIAMQRFSLENHLRAMSRVPSYQSHPKYQEYLMRYRELVRLQQNVDYQGMLQEAPKIPSPSNTSIPPINLQFDQNGVLINSSYNPNHFHGMLNPINSLGNTENIENADANRLNVNRSLESQNQSLNLSRDNENINHVNEKHPENYLMQKNDGSDFDNLIVNVDDIDMSPVTAISADVIAKARTPGEKPNPKEFANKPDLDVRQFLANWDETEDEEGLATTYSEEVINNTNTNNSSTNINSNVKNSDMNNSDNNTNNNRNESNSCSNNNNDNNNINENVNSAVTTNVASLTKVNLKEVNQQKVEKSREPENNSEQATIVNENLIVQSNVDNIDVEGLKTIEELANSGAIVQCIQTDTDNIPTIHIVDHLSGESELSTIQTVYGDVTSLTIEQISKAPIEIINETSQGQETITLFESDTGVCIKLPECDVESINAGVEGRVVVEEVVASIIDASVEITESLQPAKQVSESNNESRPKDVAYEKSLMIPQENQAQECSLSIKDHQNSENSNLKKQSSFASEESHNPDDISLPDLPMSECTPVSTTLNTPIHSDSEESSGHITELSISTNPIEIIPNSPIISFTHSPIKINPYENLENGRLNDKRSEDPLDFDIHRNSNSKNKFDNNENNKTVIEDFEIARRSKNNNSTTDVESEEQHNNKVPLINSNTVEKDNKTDQKDEEFYPSSDPLVGMNQESNTVFKRNSDNSSGIVDISNDMIPSGDCSGTPVSKILSSDEIDTGKCPSIINTEDFQHSDELDKLCNISLDDACIMPLITDEGQRNAKLSTSIEDQSFSKVINNILPISDMNVLQSSDEEPLDKDDDDWIEVKSLPESPVNLSSNEMLSRSTNCSVKLVNQSKHSNEHEKPDSSRDSIRNKKNYATNSYSPESSKSEYNSKSGNCLFEINEENKRDSRKNYVPSIFDISGESQSTDFDKFERKKQEESEQDKSKSSKDSKNDQSREKLCRNEEDIFNLNFKENSKNYNSIKCKSESWSKSYTKKITESLQNLQNEKSFESISDALKALDNYEMCTVTKSFCRANKDTDVQIQVANINVKEKNDNDADEDVDAIEIKINVSRSERSHGSKQLRDKLTEEVSEVIRKHSFFPLDSTLTTPRKIFNQRRTSLPDELDTKKPKKLNREKKRRNSGGHSFKTSRRKSTEERFVDDNRKNRYFDILSTLSESTINESIVEKDDSSSTNINKSSHLYPNDLEKLQENVSTKIFNDYTNTTNIDNIVDSKKKKNDLTIKTSLEIISKSENEVKLNCKEDFIRRESLEEIKNENTFEVNNKKKDSERSVSEEEKEKKNDFKHKIQNLKSIPLEIMENKNSLQFCSKKKEPKRRISMESMEENKRVELKNKKKDYKRRKSTGCTENENTLDFYHEKKERKLIKRLSMENTEGFAEEFNDINENTMKTISADDELDDQLKNNKKDSLKKLCAQFSKDESTLESHTRNKSLPRVLSTEKSKSSNNIINVENFENIMSKSSCDMNLGPSDASLIDNIWNKSNFLIENTSSFDFDSFDLGPSDNSFMNLTSRDDEDGISSRMDEGVRNRRLEDSERYRNPYSNVQPMDLDSSEINLNSVPVYKTQDGKITYSLNPKYTYRKLIQEAKRKDHSMLLNSIYSKLLKTYYERKSYRRRLESSENNEWEDYSPKKIKQPSYNHDDNDDQWEDEDWRKQVDTLESKFKSRWRTKLLEYEELTDNQSVIYSDTSAPPNYSPAESLFQYQHRKYSQMMSFNKKTENYRIDSPVDYFVRRQSDAFSEWDRAINNIASSPLISHHYEEFENKIDNSRNLESRLFNSNDSKSFTKNLESIEQKKVEMKVPAFIPESQSENKINEEHLNILNDEMQNSNVKSNILESIDPGLTDEDSKDVSNIAPSMTPSNAKPTVNIDVEQDSQAMLTDSGVESSTTYVEGRKSSRKLNKEYKWKKANPKLVEETIIPIKKLNDEDFLNLKTNEKLVEKNDFQEKHQENCIGIDKAVEEIFKKEENKNLTELKDEKILKLSEEKIKPTIISDIKLSEFSFKNIVKDFDSSVLKGLDLAFPLSQNSKAVQVQINREPVENEFKTHNEMNKIKIKENNQHFMSFLGIKKSIEGPIRRVSSDEMEERKNAKRKNLFFKDISNFIDTGTSLSTALNGDNLVLDKNMDVELNEELIMVKNKINDLNEWSKSKGNIDNKVEDSVIDSQSDYHIFEKPEVPPLRFETFNSVTHKSNETESNGVSVESGTSQYIDTLSSTQFGSECAESKSDETSNIGINFLSTSSQEAIDATDLKQVRQHQVLCPIDDQTKTNENASETINNQLQNKNEKPKREDKIFNFSGRISSESEDNSNALDGSPINAIHMENEKNKIENKETDKLLTFSGRIRNAEKIFDAQESLIRNLEKDEEKILSFSGRIPSPPKAESKLNIVSENKYNKNLTFSGKINKEECGSVYKSSISDRIPKFIIKKTDYSSISSSISQVLPSDISQKSTETKASSSHKIPIHPKIPKMIIRNVKSWPETPTVEENAVELSFPKTHENEDKVFEVKIKLDDKKQHESRKDSIKKSIGVIECKVPKMKIKLEDHQPKMIFENASMELYSNDSESSKNVPKLKIRKIKRSRSREEKSLIKTSVKNSEEEKPDRQNKNKSTVITKSPELKHTSKDFDSAKQEKIPKLKIKKPDPKKLLWSQSDSLHKKRSKTPDNFSKNSKKSSSKHRNGDSGKSKERSPSVDKESNTNSHQSTSEKVPKVIIKRTSSSAEFKCELSKDGGDAIKRDSKWQPEVKLERFKVLDSIAKESGQKKFPQRMLEIISKQTEVIRTSKCSKRSQSTRTSSDPDEKVRNKDDKTFSRHKRRHSDGEKPLYQMKESTLKILDDDSESEDFPRAKKREISKQLKDDSTLDGYSDSKSIELDSRKAFEKTASDTRQMKSCLIQIPLEEVATSGFGFSTISSCHKSNEYEAESINDVTGNETDAVMNIADIKNSEVNHFEEPESVIKLESSDESQTTIEILPASPETFRLESEAPTPLEGKRRIANGDLAQLYSEDAIPTQFELELEIVDNSSDSLDVPVPDVIQSVNETNCSTNCIESIVFEEDKSPWTYQNENGPDHFNKSLSLTTASNLPQKHELSDPTFSSSDLLVKEVLAAKETLKRCLAKNKIESSIPIGFSRPKTAAEKKQGAGFNLPTTSTKIDLKDHRNVFQENELISGESFRKDSSKSQHEKNDRKHSKLDRSHSSSDKQDKRKNLSSCRRHDESSLDSNSQNNLSLICHESIKSLKRLRETNEASKHNNSNSKKIKSSTSSSLLTTSYVKSLKTKAFSSRKHEFVSKAKNPNHSCSSPSANNYSKTNSSKNIKVLKAQESSTGSTDFMPKPVALMPILEPENQANFDVNERDTSRSPPVITKQDSQELSSESLKKNDNTTDLKIDQINKESEAKTFTDIVMQMAYHEKATIKHKRYCPLCERWFPTTERHRRHLDGYQHRHTELTQRRTVHALFMMFTGKPCPRLLPASIVRTDCVPGELTPLQIAVQDVAISLEKAAKDQKKTINEENK